MDLYPLCLFVASMAQPAFKHAVEQIWSTFYAFVFVNYQFEIRFQRIAVKLSQVGVNNQPAPKYC